MSQSSTAQRPRQTQNIDFRMNAYLLLVLACTFFLWPGGGSIIRHTKVSRLLLLLILYVRKHFISSAAHLISRLWLQVQLLADVQS